MSDTHETNARAGAAGLWRRCPWVVLLLLVPSWLFFLTTERDKFDTEHPLFFYIPDLVENPLQLVISLFITPLVNTEPDQIILITVLIGTFGVAVERRLGPVAAIGLFWGTSIAGALLGAILWHLVHPLFPDFEPIAQGGERVFNGASAGGFGFMAAYAALSPRPWLWIGLFCIWEPSFLLLVSQDFTSTFHVIAFTTGFVTVRYFPRDRLRTRNGPDPFRPPPLHPRRTA